MGLHDFTIYDAIEQNARFRGDKAALIDSQGTLNHSTLREAVDRLASGLVAQGLGPGERIAVIGRNCREFAFLYGAAARIGAILVPINWRLKPEEIGHVIEDSTPRLLVVAEEFQETWNELKDRHRVPVTVSLDTTSGAYMPYQELLGDPDPRSAIDVSDDDPYLIIHTAAVAGHSRGAMLSQRNLLMASWQLASTWQLTPSDVNLCVLPLFHVGGALTLLSVLAAGGTNVVMSAFDAEEAVDAISQHRVTVFAEFPPILQSILEKAQGKEHTLATIRHAFGIDHPETVEKFEKAAGATFWAVYGQTETSGLVTMQPYFEPPGAAGRPLPLSRVDIEDEQGHLVPAGVSGEIVTSGPTVFKGYWNLESDTRHTFRHGRHHTGDKGRMDDQGTLWYEGRMPEKELIKPGGENVYPGEVERVILEHPHVAEASVIGVPDAQWGEAIKAVCVLEPGATIEASALIDFVADRIARYKKPKHVVFVSELPRGTDGSVDRDKVKAEHGNA